MLFTVTRQLHCSGIPVPEGIDPSFLEALPDSIRMEVLLEQSAALERQRRVAAQQRATAAEPQPSGAGAVVRQFEDLVLNILLYSYSSSELIH